MYLPAQLPGVMVSAPCVTVTSPPQLSLATTPESSGVGMSELQDTVRSAGHRVITGAFVSRTVMTCAQLALLLHESLAVHVRTMVLLQSVPLEVSLKLTASTPSQSSVAVTVEAGGTWLMH